MARGTDEDDLEEIDEVIAFTNLCAASQKYSTNFLLSTRDQYSGQRPDQHAAINVQALSVSW